MSHLAVSITLCLLSHSVNSQFGFSQEQIELYELFYELKPTTFYEFLDIPEGPECTKRQIKSAYRKKAISWHPDKADESSIDPETIKPKGTPVEEFIAHRFRQATEISKILQDEDMRRDYDDVLKYGLPAGMSFILGNKYGKLILKFNIYQVILMLVIVLTGVHYMMLWGRHVERTWAINSAKSNITTKNKHKLKERMAKFDNLVLETPTWRNSLPVVTVNGLIWLVKDYPKIAKERKEHEKQKSLMKQERMQAEKNAVENAENVKIKREEQKKANKKKHQDWLEEKRLEAAARYEEAIKEQEKSLESDSEMDEIEAMWSDSDNSEDRPKKSNNKKGKKKKNKGGYVNDISEFKTGEFSEEEVKKFTQLLLKWPVGTPNRMGRLSEEMLRSENDLTKELKKVRASQTDTKKHVTSSVDGWSQEQQRSLEEALKIYTKDYQGESDRWTAVSNCVTDKNRGECIARYKILVQAILDKKRAGK